ncbi:hypothetical protein CVIRNUC_008352 [Coccomyxa viridis]|uniref:Uncharacterized protein n=1 Tax=Coccomyxa viridis TaxID=1274662 RepID=A0AAV1ICR5_9CHLO|nr:hypothetical protein CVIRNUC_008352 [Coccomyxa viridis]
MDLSRFLSGGVKHEGAFDDLAQSIGKEIYIDIQGWHLYLRDLHVETDITMDQALASQLAVISPPSREATKCVLAGILLDMGEGKLGIPLFDAIPLKGIQDLTKILAAYNKC